MDECCSLGLWCAANVLIFLLILAKNDALNENTLNSVAQNLRRLLDELTQYFYEPCGCPIQFTAQIEEKCDNDGATCLTPTNLAPSSSIRYPGSGRVSIDDRKARKYEYSDLYPDEKVEIKVTGRVPIQLANIQDNKQAFIDENEKIAEIFREYKKKKEKFDKDMEEFKKLLDENEAGIAYLKVGLSLAEKERELERERGQEKPSEKPCQVIEIESKCRKPPPKKVDEPNKQEVPNERKNGSKTIPDTAKALIKDIEKEDSLDPKMGCCSTGSENTDSNTKKNRRQSTTN